MTEGLAAGAPLVLDLLNYIEQVEKLKTKPAFTVPSEFFVAHQHELKGLPELAVQPAGRRRRRLAALAALAGNRSAGSSTSNSSLG
jgi:hypothetical protein